MKKILHTLIIYSKKRTTNLTWLKLSCFLLFLIFNTNIHSQEWVQVGTDNDVKLDGQIYDVSINSDGAVKAIVYGTATNDGLKVYKFIDNSWTQIGSDITFPLTTGYMSVSISSNGSVVAIARSQAEVNGFDRVGTVDIYNVNSNSLTLISHLDGWYAHDNPSNDGENDEFGNSIELNNDGTQIAIGVRGYNHLDSVDYTVPNSGILGVNRGEVRLYSYTIGVGFQLSHTFDGYFTWDDSNSGSDQYNGTGNYGSLVALSDDGLTMATTGFSNYADDSQNQHIIRVFRYSNGWNALTDINIPYDNPSDLVLNSNGSTIAISNSYNKGVVKIYNYDGTDYNLVETINGFYSYDSLGCSIALDATGTKIAIGARNDNGSARGQVKVYEKNGASWDFIQKLVGQSYYNNFGSKVDLSLDGSTFIAASLKTNTGEFLARVEAFRYLSTQIPSNFTAANITSTSVDLNWDYVVGPSTYILKYRKIGTIDWVVLAETENTTINIDNLNYNTNYEAQIQHLYSDTNTSSFSSSLLFTTLAPLLSDLTFVPDDNFEQALIDEGLDDVLDNYVITNNINSIGFLDVSNKNIDDLTGIEDFEELETFVCSDNNLTTIDASSNHFFEFACNNNQLTSLILNIDSRVVDCSNNLLTTLIIPDYIANIDCSNNNITSLDFSSTKELSILNVSNNDLTFLDFRNGENAQISSSYDYNTGYDYSFDARNNPNLTCVFVDDADFCTTNWKKVDATTRFVNDQAGCDATTTTTTNVPDTNFEHYLETHSKNGSVVAIGDSNSLGNGIDGDHLVTTSKIKSAIALRLDDLNISDLTGIEEFTSLTDLSCSDNNLTTLPLPPVTSLANLYVENNNLTSINLPTTLSEILEFGCANNNITNINFSNVSYINFLVLDNNKFVNLDFSTTVVDGMSCSNNPDLENIDFRNGADYTDVYGFRALNNPKLTCIFVDDVTYATTNWTDIDANAKFVLDQAGCDATTLRTTYIPDDNFEQVLIDAHLDDVLDDYVLTDNITNLTFLDVSNKNISDLTGIEDFVSLTQLSCSDNSLTSIDVTKNTSLIYLKFSYNQISTVDLSQNVVLEQLIGVHNELTNIDVTNNAHLKRLEIWINQISTINISNNLDLEFLSIIDNPLTTLDVSKNTVLKELDFGSSSSTSVSQISNIDVSNNVQLENLGFINTQISEVDVAHLTKLSTLFVRNNKLKNLDVSQNSLLTDFVCNDNQLKTLNLKNGNNSNIWRFNATNNWQLNCIEVDDPVWSTTNWTSIDNQSSFGDNCHYFETYVPDDNFEQALIDLGYDSGSLDDYVLTDNIKTVTTLEVSNKNIADLTGLEDFAALTYLDCSYNVLTSLSTFSNENIQIIRAHNNQISNLDINGNVNLTQLYCGDNNLTSLDYLYYAPYLNFLSIENNQISFLDIGGNGELLNLFVDGNNLSSLNVFYNPKLTVISANNNQLTSINVMHNLDLFYLYLSNNLLTELNLTNNPVLSRLLVRNNQLTSLDIRTGNNTNISNGVFNTINNPNLTCIFVDDVTWSTANWTNIDATSNFVIDEAACTSLAVGDYEFKGFKILSNPVSEYIKISIEEEANYELIDLNGKLLKRGELSMGYNSIKVSSMAKGLCFLRITNKRNSSVKKIIIK